MAQVRYAGLFPFCFTPTTNGSLVGDGTWYPLGFTKEEVCALYWKNKSYSASSTENTSITYTGGYTLSGSLSQSGETLNYVDLDGRQFAPTVETDFVCADVTNNMIGYYNESITSSSVNLFGYEYINYRGFASLTTNCYYYNGLYYPALILINQGSLASAKGFPGIYEWTPSQLDLISVTATCTFLGRNVPMYWVPNYPPTTIDPEDAETTTEPPTLYVTGGTVSGSMVITLNEQWPYNP